MSLEDNTKDPNIIEDQKPEGFFGHMKDLGQHIKKDFDALPVIGKVDDVFKGGWDIAFGTEEERGQALESLDVATGGFSQIGEIFKDDNKLSLSEEQKENLSKIQGFQEKGQAGLLGVPGALEAVGLKDPTKYIKGNKEELESRLLEINEDKISEEFISQNNKILTQLNNKVKKEAEAEVNAKIEKEIESYKISGTVESINKRREELWNEVVSNVQSKYTNDYKQLDELYKNRLNEVRESIINEYIVPVEGYSALETYEKGVTTNSSINTDNLLRKQINDEMNLEFNGDDWKLENTRAKDQYFLMEKEVKEKMLRDRKHFYETMSIARTDEEKEKFNALLLPQMEAREFLHKQTLSEYKKLIGEQEDLESVDYNILDREAWDIAYDKLNDNQKKALLNRDGTDTAVAMLHDSIEFKKRVGETLKATSEGDIGGMAKGFTLAVGNVLQEVVHGVGAAGSVVLGGLASTTIKTTDKDKIYLDEYELVAANDSVGKKALRHIFYNVDDILEVVIPVGVSSKVNFASKAVNSGVTKLQKAKQLLAKEGMGKPLLSWNTVKGLGLQGASVLTYGARGLAESLPASTIIDRHLRTADTEMNAYINAVGDTLLEPVFRIAGKGLGAADQAAGLTTMLKTNPISQWGYSVVMGEKGLGEAVDIAYSQLKEQGESITKQQVYKSIQQQNALVYAQAGKNLTKIIDNQQELADAFVRGINKLKETSEVGANKILDDSGMILKLEDNNSYKADQGNQIVTMFNKIQSEDNVTSQLGQAELDKFLKDIPKILEGKASISNMLIKLDKKDKNTQIDLFNKRISKLEEEVDINKKQVLLIELSNQLFDIATSTLNKSKDKLESTITLFDPMGLKKVSIPVSSISKLKESDAATYEQFLKDGTIKVTDANKEALGVAEPGVFKTDGEISLFFKLRRFDDKLFDMINQMLKPKIKGQKGQGYSVSGNKKYNKDNIDLFKNNIEEIFGSDNVSFKDMGTTKYEELKGETESGRAKIDRSLKAQDSLISISYGTYINKEGKETFNFYMGLGKKAIEGDGIKFDVSKSYEDQSAEVIRDILSRGNIEDGIKFAKPNNSIDSLEGLTESRMDEFLMNAFTEMQKEGEFIKTGLDGEQLTDKGSLLAKAIKSNFKYVATDNNNFNTWLFQIFATRFIDNNELLSEVFKSLRQYKQAIKDGTEVEIFNPIDSIEKLNTLVKSFSGEKTLARGSEKFKKQFSQEGYKKIAKSKYKEYVINRTTIKEDLEYKINELETSLSTSEARGFIEDRIDLYKKNLDRINGDLEIKEDEYVNRILDGLFNDAFTNYTHGALLSKFGFDELKPAKLKNEDELNVLLKEKDKLSLRLAENPLYRIEKLQDRLKSLVYINDNKKNELLKGGKTQEELEAIEFKLADDELEITALKEDIANIKKGITFKDKVGLLENRKQLKADILNIDKTLDTIKSSTETDIDFLKIFNKLSDNFKNDFNRFFNKEALRLDEVFNFIRKHEDEINKYPQVTHLILDKLSKAKNNDGDFYSNNAIRFIGREKLGRNIVSMLDNERDYQGAIEENIIDKIFSTSLTGAKNDEQLLGIDLFNKIKADYEGKGNTLQEMYLEGGKLKDFIDGLHINIKSDKILYKNIEKQTEESFKKFKELIDGYLKDIDITFRNDKGETFSIHDNKIKTDKVYKSLYKRFKALKYSTELNSLKIYKDAKGRKYTELTPIVGEEALVTKELIDSIPGYRVLHIGAIDNLKYISLSETQKGSGYIANKDSKLKLQKGNKYYASPDFYKDVTAVVNGTKTIGGLDRGAIMKELGIEKGEYLMGTYGDKDGTLMIYKPEQVKGKTPSYEQIEKDFEDKLKFELGFNTGKEGVVYDNTAVGKRLSALVSTKPIYEDINIKTTTYVLEEKKPTEIGDKLYKQLTAKQKRGEIINDTEWNTFYSEIKSFDPDFEYNREFLGMSDKQRLDTIEKVYFTDSQDGTSFISSKLGDIYDLVTTGSLSKNKKAIKTHATNKIGDNRYLGKTLFNRADIKFKGDDTFKDDAVIIGDSSVKLGKSKDVVNVDKAVYINGIKHRVIKEIRGTNTQDFKSAKAESLVKKDKYTLSKQILNILPFDIKNAVTDEMKVNIDEIVEKHLRDVGVYDKNINIYGDEGDFIKSLQRVYNVGGASDTVITARIEALFTEIKNSINSYKIGSSNPTVLESMIDLPNGTKLTRNQVIIKKNGIHHENILKVLKGEKKKLENLGENKTEEQIIRLSFIDRQLDEGRFFITSFRNPVPTRENLGTYEVIFAEDIRLNTKTSKKVKGEIYPRGEYVKDNDIVAHPESAVVKQESDYDGDTNILVPLATKISELISRGSLGYKVTDNLYNDLFEGNFNNKITSVDQVEADTDKAIEKIEEALSIVSAKNVEAKTSVGIVFGTAKIINILRQYTEELKYLNEVGDKEGLNKLLSTTIKGKDIVTVKGKKEHVDKDYTLKEVLGTLIKLDETGEKKGLGQAIEFADNFSSKIGSISQMVLDFAKSDATEFPKEKWIKEILDASGIKQANQQEFFYKNILNPMVLSYAKPVDMISHKDLGKFITKDGGINRDYFKQSLGYQRELTEYFVDNYAVKLNQLRQRSLNKYIVDSFRKGVEGHEGKTVTTSDIDALLGNNSFSTMLNEYKNFSYLDDSQRGIIKNVITKIGEKNPRIGEQIKERNGVFARLFAEDDIDYMGSVIKELKVFNSKGEPIMNQLDRNLLGLYSLSYGNNKLFNLLNESELLDYVNYSTLYKTKQIVETNKEFKPVFLLKGDIDTEAKLVDKAKDNIGKLEDKKSDIEKQLIEIDSQLYNINDTGDINKMRVLSHKIHLLKERRKNLLAKKEELLDELDSKGINAEEELIYIEDSIKDIKKSIIDLRIEDKEIKTGINSIDSFINLNRQDAFKLKQYKESEADNLYSELKIIEEYNGGNKDALKLLTQKREQILDKIDKIENPENIYVKNVDITYKLNDTELKGLKANIQVVNDVNDAFKQGMKLKLESELYSRSEDGIQRMNTARELYGKQGQLIRKMHFKALEGLRKQLKKSGLTKIQATDASNIIDNNIIDHIKYVGDKYIFNEEGLRTALHGQGENSINLKAIKDEPEHLLSQEQKDLVLKESKKFIEVYKGLTEGLNKMNTYYKDQGGYDISRYPKTLRHNYVQDMIGSFVGDLQFEFRRSLIVKSSDLDKGKSEFISHMRKEAKKNGAKFSDSKAGKIYDYLYSRADTGLIKWIKEIQGGYYFLGYQAGSLALGGMGHIASLTQVLGNFIEVLSYNNVTKGDIDSYKVLKALNAFGEDTAAQGLGVDPQLANTYSQKLQQSASRGTQSAVDFVTDRLKIKDPLQKQAIANTVDSIVNEPLLATDMLQDSQRRLAAMNHVISAMGFANEVDVMKYIQEGSKNADRVKSLFYRKYNEIGGGVISTSPIYRETFLTTWNNYPAKVFTTLSRLLMGWSIHKVGTMAEKIFSVAEAIKLVHQGDLVGSRILLKEFSDFAAIQMMNIGLAAGLTIKFEKHDLSEEEEKVDKSEVITSLTNNLTALEMLFGKEITSLEASGSYGYDTQAAMVAYGMMKNMTRTLNVNAINWLKTASDRVETLDENIVEALHKSAQQLTQSYMRNAHGMSLSNIYGDVKGSENIYALGYGIPDTIDKAMLDLSKEKLAAKIDTVGLSAVLGDLFINYFDGQYIGNPVLRKASNELFEDKAIQSLYNGIGEHGYNLNNLLITDGQLDDNYIDNAYKHLITYQQVGTEFDKDGRKILSGGAKYDSKMDDMITKQLADLGYSKEEFLTHPKTRLEGLAKLMYEIDQGAIPELKTKHLTSWIGTNLYYDYKKSVTDSRKELPYLERGLTSEEDNGIKYQVLKDLEKDGLLDLNLENHKTIMGLHIDKYHGDLVETLDKVNQDYAIKDYMNGLLIADRNLKDGDTNAKYLNTMYSRALKGIGTIYSGGEIHKPSANAVEGLTNAALKYLKVISESAQPGKEQTAKMAAVLNGLNSAGWNMLRDNEVFNMMTKESQRQLISWTYHTNDMLLTYDSNSVSNYADANQLGGSKKTYSSFFKKGMSSGYSSGSRPGFSKQFPQIKEFIRGRDIPNNYKNIVDNYTPTQRFSFDYINFPLVRQTNMYKVQELYRDIMSGVEPKVKIKTRKAKPQTKYVKVSKKKARLPKGKVRKAPQPIYRKGSTIKGLPGDIRT